MTFRQEKTKEINKEALKKRKELWRIHKCTFWKETNKAWNEKKIESKSHRLGIYKVEKKNFFLMLWWQAK